MNGLPRIRRLLTATAMTLCIASPVHAVGVIDPTPQWGTGAQSGTMKCADFSPNCGVGVYPPGSQGPDVDNFQGLTGASAASDGFGAAAAHAALNSVGGLDMPHLYGQSFAATGGVVFGTSWALDHYTYTGPSTTKHLTVSLAGTVTAPNTPSFNEINASVYVFDAAQIQGQFGFTDYRGYFGEVIQDYQQSTLSLAPGQTSDSGTIDINLDNGGAFYIFAYLGTSAGNGGSASAMNSLDLAFDSNAGLSAVSMVPEPSAWAMLLAGLGVLGFGARGWAVRA